MGEKSKNCKNRGEKPRNGVFATVFVDKERYKFSDFVQQSKQMLKLNVDLALISADPILIMQPLSAVNDDN